MSENEGYPPGYKKLVLMVSPEGEYYAVGGDKNEKSHPEDEDSFPGMDYLNAGIERNIHESRKAALHLSQSHDPKIVSQHLRFAFDQLRTLEAILTLEYHDKNHLAHGTNPKLLNETQRDLLDVALNKLDALRKELGFPVDC